MILCCVGLSHRTASLEVRERFALGFEEAAEVLSEVRSEVGVSEAVWLSTCNRVELYAVFPNEAAPDWPEGRGEADWVKAYFAKRAGKGFLPRYSEGLSRLFTWIFGRPGIGESALAKALYCAESIACVEHLYRVASGLDSMVLGETEVLGQMKEAYETSRRLGYAGRVLNPVFQGAFRTAKQVRSETGIQRGSVSIASLAAEAAEQTLGGLEGRQVLVLGAGDTGEKVIRALLERGAGEIRVGNRTLDRGRALASSLGSGVVAVSDWHPSLVTADVVIGSTSSPGHVLDAALLEPAMRIREGRRLLVLDLAVPRDVDPAVATLPGVILLDLEDFEVRAERHLELRRREVVECENIVRQRAGDVMERIDGKRVTTIRALEP